MQGERRSAVVWGWWWQRCLVPLWRIGVIRSCWWKQGHMPWHCRKDLWFKSRRKQILYTITWRLKTKKKFNRVFQNTYLQAFNKSTTYKLMSKQFTLHPVITKMTIILHAYLQKFKIVVKINFHCSTINFSSQPVKTLTWSHIRELSCCQKQMFPWYVASIHKIHYTKSVQMVRYEQSTVGSICGKAFCLKWNSKVVTNGKNDNDEKDRLNYHVWKGQGKWSRLIWNRLAK